MKVLALYFYPVPKGTPYTADELSSWGKVKELFDYMQILLAVISKEGWDFLIDYYGYEKLFEINHRAEWIDCDTLDAFVERVEAEREISPERI